MNYNACGFLTDLYVNFRFAFFKLFLFQIISPSSFQTCIFLFLFSKSNKYMQWIQLYKSMPSQAVWSCAVNFLSHTSYEKFYILEHSIWSSYGHINVITYFSGCLSNESFAQRLSWTSSRRVQKMKLLRVYGLFGGKKDKNEDDDAPSKVTGLLF